MKKTDVNQVPVPFADAARFAKGLPEDARGIAISLSIEVLALADIVRKKFSEREANEQMDRVLLVAGAAAGTIARLLEPWSVGDEPAVGHEPAEYTVELFDAAESSIAGASFPVGTNFEAEREARELAIMHETAVRARLQRKGSPEVWWINL